MRATSTGLRRASTPTRSWSRSCLRASARMPAGADRGAVPPLARRRSRHRPRVRGDAVRRPDPDPVRRRIRRDDADCLRADGLRGDRRRPVRPHAHRLLRPPAGLAADLGCERFGGLGRRGQRQLTHLGRAAARQASRTWRTRIALTTSAPPASWTGASRSPRASAASASPAGASIVTRSDAVPGPTRRMPPRNAVTAKTVPTTAPTTTAIAPTPPPIVPSSPREAPNTRNAAAAPVTSSAAKATGSTPRSIRSEKRTYAA